MIVPYIVEIDGKSSVYNYIDTKTEMPFNKLIQEFIDSYKIIGCIKFFYEKSWHKLDIRTVPQYDHTRL